MLHCDGISVIVELVRCRNWRRTEHRNRCSESMSLTLLHICQWFSNSSVGLAIHESPLMFPIIETVHVLGITLLVGTAAVLDLRLLGVVLRQEKVSDIVTQIEPLAIWGCIIMFVSGFFLFWSEAEKNYSNLAFRIKLVLLFFAGLNPLIFHSTVYRSVATWNEAPVAPRQARVTAVLSLTLWAAIIVCGRAIAYYQ